MLRAARPFFCHPGTGTLHMRYSDFQIQCGCVLGPQVFEKSKYLLPGIKREHRDRFIQCLKAGASPIDSYDIIEETAHRPDDAFLLVLKTHKGQWDQFADFVKRLKGGLRTPETHQSHTPAADK